MKDQNQTINSKNKRIIRYTNISKCIFCPKDLALLTSVCLNAMVFTLSMLFLVFYSCFFILEKASAQALSLGIEPPIIQIQAKPPASINTPITLENTSDQPANLRIVYKAFTASDAQNGFVKYYPEDTPEANPPIFKYIQIADNKHNVDTIKLAPGQTKTLIMHLGIPKDIDMGDYYFSIIFVSAENDPQGDKTASTSLGGIATNVLLSLQPTGPSTGEIVEFSSPFFVQEGPVPFTLRLKNTSGHYLTPRGEILIRNMFGQTIGRVDLLPVNVLSKTTRAIPDMLMSPDATKPANFVRPVTRYEAAVWPEKFLLGPYTATFTLALSDQGPIFKRTIFFIAFPWYMLVSFTLALAILGYLGYRIRKRMNK